MKRLIPTVLTLLLVAAFQCWADENKIGEIQTVRGMVVAVSCGQKRSLKPRAPVYAQDMLAVGVDGFLQVMFKDGTVLAMREDSTVEIRQFVYEIGEAENSVVDLNMHSGGLRFLTGKTVKGNPDGFQVETPLGTIGIQGTEGTVETTLKNNDAYSNDLNLSINAPGPGWNQRVTADVTHQTVNHVDGEADRAMSFTDRVGKTVLIEKGRGVEVNKDTGAEAPRPNPPGTVVPAKQKTSFNKVAKTPTKYRNHFSGYEGGGSPSANTMSHFLNSATATPSPWLPKSRN